MENRIEKKRLERVGEISYNTFGSKMIIVEYYNFCNLIVKFTNGYTVKTDYRSFKNGWVKNPYDKTVYGVGYLGEGEYKANINNKQNHGYGTWSHMLRRCYSDLYHKEKPSYIDCIVAEEWHNFQNFAEWFKNNYYTIDNETMCLDKDILIKKNKIYSPETCIFVPQNINSLFVNCNKIRGAYPLGVCFNKKDKRYEAHCSNGKGLSQHLGHFKTPEDAFYLGYKPYKEKLIKQIADEYKNKIPEKLYQIMYQYEVEITD